MLPNLVLQYYANLPGEKPKHIHSPSDQQTLHQTLLCTNLNTSMLLLASMFAQVSINTMSPELLPT